MSELINSEKVEPSSNTNENNLIEKENLIQQPIFLEHLENPSRKLPENTEENRTSILNRLKEAFSNFDQIEDNSNKQWSNLLEFVNDFKISFFEQYVNLSTLKDDYKNHLIAKNSIVNRINKSIHTNIKSLKDSKSTTAVVKHSSMKKNVDKNLTPSKSEKVISNENKSFKKQPLKKEINLESDDKSSNLNKTLPSKGVKKIREFNNKGKEENASKQKDDVAADSKGMKVYKLNSTMKEKSNMKINDRETKESKEVKEEKKPLVTKNPKFVPKTPLAKKTKTEEKDNDVDKSDTKSTKNTVKQIPKTGVKPNTNFSVKKNENKSNVVSNKQDSKPKSKENVEISKVNVTSETNNATKTDSNSLDIKVESISTLIPNIEVNAKEENVETDVPVYQNAKEENEEKPKVNDEVVSETTETNINSSNNDNEKEIKSE